MPNLKGHITGAVLMFPAYYAAYQVVGILTNDLYKPSSGVLVLSYVLFVIGGDLPDIDAQASPIRWFAQAMVPAMFLMSLWNFKPLVNFFSSHFHQWGDLLYLSAIIIGGFLLGYMVKFLKHRGFLHTSSFALIYALTIYSWLRWGMNFKGNDLLFTSLAAFFGVYTHLLLDYKNPLVFFRIFPKGPFS